MITLKESLTGHINSNSNLSGTLNNSILSIYPELEDLEIIPTAEEQNFKSKKYGFGNVKVNPVVSEELNITPSTENQTKEGIYNKVTVEGDEDLKAENIKEGVNIFGVEGIVKSTNAKITDGANLFSNGARTDYLNELLSLCENIKSANNMFNGCSKLTELDISNLDTGNVTNMVSMFGGCSSLTELDASNFNTNNVTNMVSMFASCSGLTELNVSNFNTINVTDMSYMFNGCRKLTELDVSNFNTSNVTNMSNMFGSLGLTELNLSNFDMSKVINVGNIFSSCTNLTNLISFKNLGKGYTQKTANYSNYKLTLSSCNKLTHDSLMSVINNLYDLNLTYDVANGGTLYTQGLVLGSTNKAKLTADEIAIATSKGWTVT